MASDDFRFRWHNFHGYRDTKWVSSKPLTIILGANNSGKSSLLLPLLLMKQTADASDAGAHLVTRGELANAGSYADLVYRGEASFSFDMQFQRSSSSAKPKHVGHHPPGRVRHAFRDSRNVDAEIFEFEVFDIFNRRMLRRAKSKSDRYSLVGVPRDADRKSESRPASLFDRRLRKLIARARPNNLMFEGAALYSQALLEMPHESVHGAADELLLSNFSAEYLQIVDYAAHALNLLLEDMSYVGPLRHAPKRFYELSGEPPSGVGLLGENTPELIYRNRDDRAFSDHLRGWLGAFEFARDVHTARLTEGAFSIEVALLDSGENVNFADLGFGMSQILPLIVQSILSKRGDRIIAAQPEIHLNPRLQGTLADLLVETVDRGVRVLVETHSEHLLLRLRRLIAEEKLDADDVALYFVERIEGTSTVRQVDIDSVGHIDAASWPKGFFGDSLKESMALASAQARRVR